MPSSCEQSWAYLKSWADADDRLHGIIATWWDSSETETDPHVLNHAPVVEAFCTLYERFGDRLYREEAERWSRFLLESLDERSGLFLNSWADVPSKPTGVLQQAAVSSVLIRLACLTGEDRALKAAVWNLKACDCRWSGVLLNGVVNQALEYARAVCRLREPAPEEYKQLSRRFSSLISQISDCVRPMPKGGKLIEQGCRDSLLMTIYQIACLPGLGALAEVGLYSEYLRGLISDVVRGIVENLYLGEGLFASHIPPAGRLTHPVTLRALGLLRRLPIGARGHRTLERIRRALDRATGPRSVVTSPIWLARSAGSALALKSVASFLPSSMEQIIGAIDRRIRTSQLPHGGVPNCVGPWKDGKPAWQSLVCSTRWNAHVFRYFAESCNERPGEPAAGAPDCAWGDASISMHEDAYRVQAVLNESGRVITWHKPGTGTR